MKIIKFSTKHCPTCKKLNAILEKLNIHCHEIVLKMPDDIKIAKKYEIESVPTIVKRRDGRGEIDRITGLVPIRRIKEFFGVEDET